MYEMLGDSKVERRMPKPVAKIIVFFSEIFYFLILILVLLLLLPIIFLDFMLLQIDRAYLEVGKPK